MDKALADGMEKGTLMGSYVRELAVDFIKEAELGGKPAAAGMMYSIVQEADRIELWSSCAIVENYPLERNGVTTDPERRIGPQQVTPVADASLGRAAEKAQDEFEEAFRIHFTGKGGEVQRPGLSYTEGALMSASIPYLDQLQKTGAPLPDSAVKAMVEWVSFTEKTRTPEFAHALYRVFDDIIQGPLVETNVAPSRGQSAALV
jgi:hypothetical protein